MKIQKFIFLIIVLSFLAIATTVSLVLQTKKSVTHPVFCVESVECVKDRKYFGVKYHLYSQEDCYVRIFSAPDNSPVIEGIHSAHELVHGGSEFGPLRIFNPEKFSSMTSIDKKEWLLLDIGKEYVLEKDMPLPIWKIENDDKTISTVFILLCSYPCSTGKCSIENYDLE